VTIPTTPPRGRFNRSLREALVVLLAATGLSLAYGAITQKGLFQPELEGLPRETRLDMPPAPMMISVEEAEKLFREGGAVFVDARSEFDFRLGHIQGAINLPLNSVTADAVLLPEIPRDSLIVTYCDGQNCNSSIDLAARLYALGFQKVRIFFGGWDQWQERDLPKQEGAQ
jgi:rhodanese-related sulfurtransferase